MLTGLKNAFSIKELRGKIIFTIAMLVLYRLGAHIPVPGIPFPVSYTHLYRDVPVRSRLPW